MGNKVTEIYIEQNSGQQGHNIRHSEHNVHNLDRITQETPVQYTQNDITEGIYRGVFEPYIELLFSFLRVSWGPTAFWEGTYILPIQFFTTILYN